MAPPLQLVKGDKYNLTLGVVIALILAACKDIRGLSPFARLQLRAYTVWNLAFLGVRVAFNQAQWDSFLAVNSFGIACGFRTAMCQGIGENMRKKLDAQLAHDGLSLPRWRVCGASAFPLHTSETKHLHHSCVSLQFFLADHAIHTLPPLVLITALVRRAERVHPLVRGVPPNPQLAHSLMDAPRPGAHRIASTCLRAARGLPSGKARSSTAAISTCRTRGAAPGSPLLRVCSARPAWSTRSSRASEARLRSSP